MSKTLSEYLNEATDYLFPVKNSFQQAEERERILALCTSTGLDEKFLKLVENDPNWKAMAEKVTVEYFVDIPKSLTAAQKAKLPNIEILMVEYGKVPAIKVTCLSRP